MDKKLLAGILLGIAIVVGIAYSFPLSDSTIPPTDAIQTIFVGIDPNDNVTARTYDGNVTFIAGAGISILDDYANSELTFSSGAGSSTWEQLTNVTDTGCAINQVRKAVAGQWVCADDEIGDSLTLEQLLNVTDVGCASGQVRKAVAGQWVCANDDNTGSITTLESLTNVTDTGCAINQIRKVDGAGSWICATDETGSGGIASINGDSTSAQVFSGVAGNITITDTGAGTLTFNTAYNIVTTGGSAQIITKGLTLNALTLGGTMNSAGQTIDNVGFIADNSGAEAGAGFIRMGNTAIIGWEASPASTDLTITSDASENFVLNSGWNNIDFGLNPFINAIFDVAGTGNRLTSTAIATGDILKSDGVDFKRLARGSAGQVLKVNAGGTDIEWGTDNTGAGGSGIPLPPKKWGQLMPRSASADLLGLAVTCTISATASFVYDTTDNSNAILSTTAITDGVNGGIACVASNTNSFRGVDNAYMYARWEENKITTNRIFIGFSSSATALPNNADTILDAIDGAGLCIRTTDTVYQFCSNDGTGAMAVASLTTTEDTGVHFFEVYTTNAGATWCGKLDGGTAVCSSTATDIPTTTDRLFAISNGETDGGATAILWTQYQFYIQNDR